MEKILRNTHKQSNIELLKARDFYFDKARGWYYVSLAFIALTPFILAVSYLPFIPFYNFVDEQRDILIGFIIIGSFLFIQFVCKPNIEKNLIISNEIREEYDCRVFELPSNPYLSFNDVDVDSFVSNAKKVKDYYKYEVWYQEVFCGEHSKNVICSQLDNIIYTYYAYKDYRHYAIIISILSGLFTLCALCLGVRVFVLVFVAFFNFAQFLVENLSKTTSLIKQNKRLMDILKENDGAINKQLKNDGITNLRMLQDVVASNRNQSLFIPKYIRDKYLKEKDSPFYKELNIYKSLYLDEETVSIPSRAEDIELYDQDEKEVVSLQQIQDRLIQMFSDVSNVFNENGITYTLDGGTLIGALREHRTGELNKGGFVFWDDDIDIAIPIKDKTLDRAKQLIKENLSDKYEVQDYASDPYYSPRLSNFRIRDKKSITSEKDSKLYGFYNSRGLFIDVYAYSPILCSRLVDSIFRKFFIHPLNRWILRIENKCGLYGDVENKEMKKFSSLKKMYLNIVSWYTDHANCDQYYAYVPNFICDYCHSGPYIKKEDLYGESLPNVQFESIEKLPIPIHAEKVLSEYYGDWTESPFISMQDLQKEYGNEQWFDKKIFMSTVLKHISQVKFL